MWVDTGVVGHEGYFPFIIFRDFVLFSMGSPLDYLIRTPA